MTPLFPRLSKTLVVLFVLFVTSLALQAATPLPTVNSVTFNHLTEAFVTPPSLRLRDGEVFQIRITETSPLDFEYVVAGIEPKKEGDTNEAGVTLPLGQLENKSFWVMHDKKFAGYIVKIKRPKDATGTVSVKDDNGRVIGSLRPTEFSVEVRTMQWAYGVAGAFTASELTDPKYSLVENGEGKKIVTKDEDAEDNARLGLGAFLHLYHTRVPQVGITFGLGINEGNRTTYFVGPSWRFGDQGALTLGYALGSIDRLPNGQRENEVAKDDNILSNLPTRTVGRFFVALSYSFLDVGLDRLKKPFAGSGTSTTTVTTGDQSSDSQGNSRNGGGSGGTTDSGGAGGTTTDTGAGGTTSSTGSNQNNDDPPLR